MQALRNTFEDLWAAAMFFTRLPLWRIHQPPQEHFRHVVHYWPFVGWLTGGAMALFFVVQFFAAQKTKEPPVLKPEAP